MSLIVRTVMVWAVMLASTVPSAAQLHTGRVDATVVDLSGSFVPGATVTLSGPQAHKAVTGSTGDVHFLNLPPGSYWLTVTHTGFSDHLNRGVVVSTGTSVSQRIELWPAGATRQVQVRNETPFVDPRKTGVATHVSGEEMQNTPSSRDPWAVLQTIPAVFVDRLNVGGSEAGRQQSFRAKGASTGDNTWNLDGIAITDMTAPGFSSNYFDFDMFEDMQVTTGGADIMSPTAGVQVNLVLKSGSNTPRGSSRIYFVNDRYRDYGVEAGGPIAKDKVWAWGGVGRTHVDRVTFGLHERADLTNGAFKADAQLTNGVRVNYTFFRGDKDSVGDTAGPAIQSAPSYTQDGATTLNKGEATFAIGGDLFLAVRGAHLGNAFTVATTPKVRYSFDRPQNSAAVDGNSFHGRHELKFGFGWRTADDETFATNADYISAYGGDAWTMDRLTLNLGVRWDRAVSSTSGSAVKSVPIAAEIVENTVSPRVGFTYAIGDAGATIARGTYAVFASQLNATAAALNSPIADYPTPRTQEATVGMDHELQNHLGVSATFTYRDFRNGSYQRFTGFEMSGQKRMSNNWMARGGFSSNSLYARYQFNLNGMYQLPRGINAGVGWVMRQGYEVPDFRILATPADMFEVYEAVLTLYNPDRSRLPRVSLFDARLEKAFHFPRAAVMLDLDVFNVTNAATVLGHLYDFRRAGSSLPFQIVDDVMGPRAVRFGGRLTF